MTEMEYGCIFVFLWMEWESRYFVLLYVCIVCTDCILYVLTVCTVVFIGWAMY